MWDEVIDILNGKNGIEFGGKTELFEKPQHNMMLYPYVSLDGANMFEDNHFNEIGGNIYDYVYGKGYRFNCDITSEEDIKQIKKKYDFIVTSHVIEHIANPIKAIKLWEDNLLRDNGYMLNIIPTYSECFDRKRPLTTIQHLINDFIIETQEDDTTHIEEQKNLHDWSMGGHKYFYGLCENNFKTRVVHHHTFNLDNVKQLFEYCNQEIVSLFNNDPLNIVCLSKK